MTILTFPTQLQTETPKYSWSDYTRLGKVAVIDMLEDQGAEFDPNTNYFKLCSLLYRAQKPVTPVLPAIDMAQKRIQKAEKRVKLAKNVHEYRKARTDLFNATVTSLLF